TTSLAALPKLERLPPAKRLAQSTWPTRGALASNENKMSGGGRERASLGVEVWKSSQKWSVRRSAVRSIAWLGGGVVALIGSISFKCVLFPDRNQPSASLRRVVRSWRNDLDRRSSVNVSRLPPCSALRDARGVELSQPTGLRDRR